MIEIVIPKIVKPLALSGYAEEFDDACLYVWVNPPKKLIDELDAAIMSVSEIEKVYVTFDRKKPAINLDDFNKKVNEIVDRQCQIYSELLSQGPEGTRMSFEEVRTVSVETSETDPAFWNWVKVQIATMIKGHRAGTKKA
ncbi:MAG: hypothetical protein GYA45_11605 [Pelolinea sp.]|nr:hypothetical protein [Pelolinea sp.]